MRALLAGFGRHAGHPRALILPIRDDIIYPLPPRSPGSAFRSLTRGPVWRTGPSGQGGVEEIARHEQFGGDLPVARM